MLLPTVLWPHTYLPRANGNTGYNQIALRCINTIDRCPEVSFSPCPVAPDTRSVGPRYRSHSTKSYSKVGFLTIRG
jgi:hypothetical protein